MNLSAKLMFQRIKKQLEEGKTLLTFGFLRTTGQGLGMIAPLVVAKFFSPELFGSYSLAKMVVFFFVSLLISSTQTPFVVFANQERAATGKINRSFSVQCAFLAFSIAAFAVLVLLFGSAIKTFAKITSGDLFFVSLAFIGIAIQTFLNNLFMALGERIKSAVLELVFGSSVLILVVILYFTNKISLGNVFLIYFISVLPLIVLFLKTTEFNLLLPFVFDWNHFKGMLNFTKWLMFSAAAVYFINWGDNLVLRPFVPMADIGDYNLGYQFFKGTAVFIAAVSAYFLPFVSQQIENCRTIKDYLASKRPKIFLLGFIGIGLLFVICPSVLRFLYGDVYTQTTVILRILLIGSLMILYNSFYYPIFEALKRYKFIVIVDIIQIFLNVLLNLLLIPKIGAKGAAVATILAYFCATVMFEAYFRIKLKKVLGL
jgi:O-antigen/teichoic acid export membrane protein